jgi:maltooligosyltrehalose trehalohydrolase
MRGDFGARVISSGEIEFRLWAPDAQAVKLILAGETEKDMARDTDGVFSTVISCKAGTPYKYLIDGTFSVPDPASRLQAGDVHDQSIIVSPSFNWRNTTWRGRPWHETVIYELHVGAFGGFDGVTENLPRLKVLGVTAIELMPIADFPGKHNWGYDGVLPYAPDSAYGTPEQLKRLIDTAHGLELQVFLDVVYNHFGPDGNYISSYASDFFDENVHTPWGGAINFKLSAVRRFFIENALYWLIDYQFDGLRFDAVHAIKDNEFLLEMAVEIRRVTHGRHVHLILENENNEPILLSGNDQEKFNAQWADDWHHCLHVLLTNECEGYYDDFQNPAQQLARCFSEGFAYQGDPSKHGDGKPRGTPSAHLPPSAFVVCLQNHDQVGNRALGERLTVLADSDSLRAAMLLLLMTPQIPMIFMGEEWGETKPFLFFTDHNATLANAVRDGRRKEFAHFSAFTRPETRQQIPDPNSRTTFLNSIPSFSSELTENQEHFGELVKQCLAVRTAYLFSCLPIMRSNQAVALNGKSVFAEWRFGRSGIFTLAVNFGDDRVPFAPADGRLLISSGTDLEFDGYLLPRTAFAWLAQDE